MEQLISDNSSSFHSPTLRLSTVKSPGNYGYETSIFTENRGNDTLESYETEFDAKLGHHK